MEVLALDRGNMFHLYALHRSVYGDKKPKGYFEKKYDTSYLGLGAIGYLAIKDNVPLSFVGLIPAEFRISGQRAIGVQSCDTMTDPRARGKGLATLLEKRAISTAKEQHMDFIYGFGNDDSVAWLTGKCGFAISHSLNRYVVRSGSAMPRRLLAKARTRFTGVFQQRAAFRQDEQTDGMIYSEGFIDYKRVNGPFL